MKNFVLLLCFVMISVSAQAVFANPEDLADFTFDGCALANSVTHI